MQINTGAVIAEPFDAHHRYSVNPQTMADTDDIQLVLMPLSITSKTLASRWGFGGF